MAYKVKIDSFEGPLDLLLHLIQQLEIDIYDIPAAEITNQYLAYVHTMQQLELDVASEYLVMAATLIAIKSRSLLPDHEAEEEWAEEEEDPREELARRLLEYKKYKEAAARLQEREEERICFYSRPPSDKLFEATEDAPLNVTIFDMLGAFQKMARRKKLAAPPTATVRREELSVEKRMHALKTRLLAEAGPVLFDDLVDFNERNEFVVSFLALLELMKQNEIVVSQTGNFADLYVTAGGQKNES